MERMETIKLAKYSLGELFEEREKFQREFESLQLAATQEPYVELVTFAQLMGITLRQLTQRGVAIGDAPSLLFSVNPDNTTQQWRGRGATPQWLLDLQVAGKSLDMVRM